MNAHPHAGAAIPFNEVRAQRAANAHGAWSDLAAAVRKACDRMVATEGRETIENVNLRGALAKLTPDTFPVEADSARKVAAALLLCGRAAANAELPALRMRVAPAALALAAAVDGLLADRLSDVMATSRAICGDDSADVHGEP